MGSATVKENLGDGKYKVEIDKDLTEINTSITKLTALVLKLETETIPASEIIYNAAQSEYTSKRAEFDPVVAELAYLQSSSNLAAVPAKIAQVKTLTAEMVKAEAAYSTAAKNLQMLKLQLLSAKKEKEGYQKILDETEADLREVWAVDYTADIAVGTKVGTVEINGEATARPKDPATGLPDTSIPEKVQITAGGKDGKGIITPVKAQDEKEWYIAEILKPGWQKWKPTFRVGIITAIDYVKNQCNIDLLYGESSVIKNKAVKDSEGKIIKKSQCYEINQTEDLKDVKFSYLTCDASAFIEGDRVVIEFEEQNWKKPIVIGFETLPRPCSVQIKIRVKSVETVGEFVTFCSKRADDWRVVRGLLDQFCSSDRLSGFVPDLVKWYNSIVGQYIGVTWIHFPREYTAEECEYHTRDWIVWMRDALPLWQSFMDKMIAKWDGLTIIARDILENATGSVFGTIDPNDQQDNVKLKDFIITFDCCPLSPDIISYPNYDIDRKNSDFVRDKYSKKLWADIIETNIRRGNNCSPVLDLSVKSTYNGFPILNFEWQALAGVAGIEVTKIIENSEVDEIVQTVHILGKHNIGHTETSDIEQVRQSVQFGVEEPAQMISFPYDYDAAIATVPLPNAKQKIDIPMSMQTSGRLLELPTTLGGRVIPTSTSSDSNWATGGFTCSEGWNLISWMTNFNLLNNYWEVVPGPDLYDFIPRKYDYGVNPWYMADLPVGCQMFYTMYYDHPIVSRKNIYPIQKRTEEEEEELVTRVDDYVNRTFKYQADNFSEWRFMSQNGWTTGDCEDYAITKAQILLEYGVDIKRLKLEGGWYEDYIEEAGIIYPELVGHMWLTFDDKRALNNGSQNLDELRARYFMRGIIQTNETYKSQVIGKYLGLWKSAEVPDLIKVEPYPSKDFDMPMWAMNAEIERTK